MNNCKENQSCYIAAVFVCYFMFEGLVCRHVVFYLQQTFICLHIFLPNLFLTFIIIILCTYCILASYLLKMLNFLFIYNNWVKWVLLAGYSKQSGKTGFSQVHSVKAHLFKNNWDLSLLISVPTHTRHSSKFWTLRFQVAPWVFYLFIYLV